ncbi:hypothetical protein PG999_001565, partial [Apiospora kogelbergensis]
GGLVFENPSDPSEEELDAHTVNTQGNFESNGEVSGAQMYSSIDVTESIFIADKSKTVQSSMKDLFGTNNWNEGHPFPILPNVYLYPMLIFHDNSRAMLSSHNG